MESRGFFANITPGTEEYDVRYEKALQKFKEKFGSGSSTTTSAGSAAANESYAHLTAAERQTQAEECKALGNSAISGQEYAAAVEHYAKAIELSPDGPKSHIYFANQAAAYTHLKQYDQVIQCCEKAIELMVSWNPTPALNGPHERW